MSRGAPAAPCSRSVAVPPPPSLMSRGAPAAPFSFTPRGGPAGPCFRSVAVPPFSPLVPRRPGRPRFLASRDEPVFPPSRGARSIASSIGPWRFSLPLPGFRGSPAALIAARPAPPGMSPLRWTRGDPVCRPPAEPRPSPFQPSRGGSACPSPVSAAALPPASPLVPPPLGLASPLDLRSPGIPPSRGAPVVSFPAVPRRLSPDLLRSRGGGSPARDSPKPRRAAARIAVPAAAAARSPQWCRPPRPWP